MSESVTQLGLAGDAPRIESKRVRPGDVFAQPPGLLSPKADQPYRCPGLSEETVERVGIGARCNLLSGSAERCRVGCVGKRSIRLSRSTTETVEPARVQGQLHQWSGLSSLKDAPIDPKDVMKSLLVTLD